MTRVILFDPDRMPVRNAAGYAAHPDLPDVPEGSSYQDELAKLGFESAYTDLQSDWMAGPVYHQFQVGESRMDEWTPTAPPGDGWQLVSIWDCEIGPTSLWIRPRRSSLVARIGAHWRVLAQHRSDMRRPVT